MNALTRGIVAVALFALTSAAVAQEKTPAPAPADPPSRMEPEKVGPRTEEVDQTQYARVLRVGPGAADHLTVAAALDAITDASESKRYAVLVSGGEYRGDTIAMKPFVDLLGGFSSDFKSRDIHANRTVLDGEGLRRVVIGADDARIDGFVIRNGKVRAPGAGILCDHASPTISNNTIIDNATTAPQDIHKEMLHQPGNDGAAIACVNGSSPTIANNLIARNTTEIGGGAGIAAANFSMPQIVNNVICDNETGLTDVNQSRSSNGAAISATKAQHRPPLRMTIVNNVISNNRANGKSDAGGIYLEYDSSPLIAGNWLVGNWCEDDGSAMYVMKASHPLFVHNIVAGNNSSALRLSKEGRGDLRDNLIFGNAVGVICISSWMDFRNNTVVDNASGLSYGNTYAPHLKPAVITNNVFYGNEGGQIAVDSSSGDQPIMTNNDVQGGYAGGEGNFDQPPQFVDDAVTGQAQSIDYDATRAATSVAVSGSVLPANANLAGRVIQIGDNWGVIQRAGDGKIVVWGDVRTSAGAEPPTHFRIAPTYQLRDALAGNVGRSHNP